MSTSSNIAAWCAWAVAAGLWLGFAGRLVMRLVAVEAGVAPGLSLGGSLEVVAFGVMLGAPVALVFWACRAKWPMPLGSGIAWGLLTFTALVALPPPAARSALAATPDAAPTTAVLFALVFASYGALLDLIWRWRHRSLLEGRDKATD